MKHHTATALLLTPHFQPVTTTLLGRYVFHSKPAKNFLAIPPNARTCFNSHDPYFPIVKPQNGGCENCRGVLGGYGYPWELRIWRRELISSKAVSVFTIFARDWLESIRSRMFMFQCGARVRARGSGRGLRTSYFPTNGNTIVLGPFMFKKNGIKGYLRQMTLF